MNELQIQDRRYR